MKWIKFTIETTTEAEDLIGAMLNECGIDAIEIEDNQPILDADAQGGYFEELQPDRPEDDGTSRVSFYLEEGIDYFELLEKVRMGIEAQRQFVSVGSGKISSTETEDEDWINNWKQYFSAFTIDDILIKPTWEELEVQDKDKLLIEIDPGVSFGTGKHETTQLCIRQLRKYMKSGDKVLDVGCGSGILSIVALKLGAEKLVGTDIDADCIQSTYENFEVNHIAKESGDFYVGNLIDDTQLQEQVGTECFDVVVANILADIIIAMAPVIPARMKQNGYFIASGIIGFKEEEVKQAMEQVGLTILESNYQGEWVNITAQKL